MADTASLIYDVATADFAQKVVDVSFERPVLVDFWAEWCGPCKTLGPLLERVVASYNGKVALAKVNVDANRELAAQLGVRSIPTVKIIVEGALADEFTGVITEPEIRAIIDSLASDGIEQALAAASQLLEARRFDEAERLYTAILAEHPDNSVAQISLARLKIRAGDEAGARALIQAVPESDPRYGEARSLLGLFEFVAVCEAQGGLEKAREAAGQNPGDLESLSLLGCCEAAAGNYRESFDAFLAVVRKDQGFEDGTARKAMITLFSVIGPDDPLTGEYRGKLARELF